MAVLYLDVCIYVLCIAVDDRIEGRMIVWYAYKVDSDFHLWSYWFSLKGSPRRVVYCGGLTALMPPPPSSTVGTPAHQTVHLPEANVWILGNRGSQNIWPKNRAYRKFTPRIFGHFLLRTSTIRSKIPCSGKGDQKNIVKGRCSVPLRGKGESAKVY